MKKYIYGIMFLFITVSFGQNSFKGMVMEKRNGKKHLGVEGVTVYWLHTNIGTTTNSKGWFSIPYKKEYKKLVIRYMGYKTDTLTITNFTPIHHFITPKASNLGEVLLKTKKKTVQQSYLKTANIFTVNSDELLKAACCNLSESFETNPSIDVHFSDALTGVKQIKMLGLTSPYLLITQENMPYVRGASQALGLTFTPGTWIESVQITKGAGSVINGFESIAGQINTELVKPLKDKKIFFNTYYAINGRMELNTHFNQKINNKWHSGLYIHGNYRNKKNDNNNDGFLDMPLSKQINVMNKWQYLNAKKGLRGSINIRYLTDKKQIGQTHFIPEKDKMTTNAWGGEINTNRFETMAKLGYVFPEIPYQSIGMQMAYSHHHQKSYFGFRNYNIKHQSWYANLLFSSIFSNTMHKFTTGISANYDVFDEKVENNNYSANEKSIGTFFEYAYDNIDDMSLTAGIRADYHSILNLFVSPRIHIRYMPFEKSTFRASAGYGKRIARIFTENQQLFGTSRIINVVNNGNNIYGLEPESAWNYGISYLQGFTLWNNQGSILLDFYRTDFLNQVVVDWENFNEISFYNLDGNSFANSFQIEVNYEIVKNLDLKYAYKLYNVKTSYKTGNLQKILQPKHRFFGNISYKTKKRKNNSQWKFDYTLQWTGKQRLPNTQKKLSDYSKAYSLMNAQITRVLSKNFEIYAGGENMTNYKQKNPILGNNEPFGNNFDSSIIYAPISGSIWYAGLRYAVK